MGIVNLKTNLKSLKFGVKSSSDRPGSGNSGQPFQVDPISDSTQPNPLDKDFLLRGGINAPSDALEDVQRLTKWFFDFKNPSGLLFIAKQNLLSLTSVRTQASGVGPNEGFYTPLSTLGQALGGFAGLHLPKQGLIPGVGVRSYGPKSSFNPIGTTAIDEVVGGEEGFGNRLTQLTDLKINKSVEWERSFKKNQISKSETSIISYIGGPKAPLGIGRTQINFATDNTGKPLRTGQNSLEFSRLKGLEFGADLQVKGLPGFNTSKTYQRSFEILNFVNNEFGPEGLTFEETISTLNIPRIKESFQKYLLKEDIESSTIMSISPSYVDATKTIDGISTSRINQLSPGQRGNIVNYTLGKRDSDGKNLGAVDKINSLPIYRSSTGVKASTKVNDLIQFRIAALNNIDPTIKEYIHFRAYLDDFSDKYSGKWKPINYMGRAEAFHKYDSFDRDISLSFTVAAQSREELMIQYKKLNFLASNLAPTYSAAGYMGGPLVTLTVGGWLYEQPGFITGLSLSPMKGSPWEIAIDENGDKDDSVSELPHIIKVSGFGFTPIHTFRPEKQILGPKLSKEGDTNKDIDITEYGKQRYIALKNSKGVSQYKDLL